MTLIYTEEQLIAEVPGLDREQLVRFVEARLVLPVQRPADAEPVYRPVDIARLRLACELCDCLDLHEDALEVIMALVDQVHSVRADLRAVLEAVSGLPEEDRWKVEKALRRNMLL